MKKIASIFLVFTLMLNLIPHKAQAEVLTEDFNLTSAAYVVVDETTGEVICSKNADTQMTISNLAQVMTAALIIENGNLTDMVTVGELPTAYGNRVMLRSGEKVTMEDLLKAIVVYSASDAAISAANHLGGTTKFLKSMNDKAAQLGMTQTVFTNVYGAREDAQVSTANDMLTLAHYVMNKEEYVTLANTPTIQWQGDVRSNSTLENTNGFLTIMPEASGLKMSNDGAGSFDLMTTVNKDGRSLTAVILGASSEEVLYSEMQTLINTCLNNTKIVPVVSEGTVMAILSFDEEEVRVSAKSSYSVCMAKTNASVIGYNIHLTDPERSIKKGDTVGYLDILQDGSSIGTVSLTAMDDTSMKINWLMVILAIISIVYIIQIALRTRRIINRNKINQAGNNKKKMLP